MIALRVLGSVDLRRDDGTAVAAVLAQPKRLALLTYLAVAVPGGCVRRDSLLALLWPESDLEHARGALNRAVYYLRQALGDAVIVGRGDSELGVAADLLWCDALAANVAFDDGRLEEGLSLCRGDFLPGIAVTEVPEFDRWLDSERARMQNRIAAAAETLAMKCEREERIADAVDWSRRAASSKPFDEAIHRQLVRRLSAAGAGAEGLREHQEFAARLRSELDVEPDRETEALVASIRAGRGAPAGTGHSTGNGSSASHSAAAPGAASAPPAVAALSEVDRGPAAPIGASAARTHSHRPTLTVVVAATLMLGAVVWLARRLNERAAPYQASATAVAEVERGEVLYEAGQFSEAVTAFENAIRADSGFALGYLRLSQAMNWTGQTVQAWDMVERAQSLRTRLAERDRRLLDLWRPFLREDPLAAESVYDALSASAREDRDVQAILGEMRFHWGPTLGWTRAEAAQALRAALKTRPDHIPTLVHLVRVAAQIESSDSTRAIAGRVLARHPSEFQALEVNVLAAWHSNDPAALNASLTRAALHPVYERQSLVNSLAATGQRPDRLVPVVRRLIGATDPALNRLIAGLVIVNLRAAAGQFEAATREARLLAPLSAAYAVEMEAVVAALPFRPPDPQRLDAARGVVELAAKLSDTTGKSRNDWARFHQVLYEPQRQFLLGMIGALAGRDSATSNAVALLKSELAAPAANPRYQTRTGESSSAWLARVLSAAYLSFVRGRHEDVVQTLVPTREILTVYPSVYHYPLAIERFLRAEALRGSSGWRERALKWYGTFPDPGMYDLPYLAPSHFRRAEIFEQMGQRDSAAVHYARTLKLWQSADAELRTWVADAQRGLQRTRGPAR